MPRCTIRCPSPQSRSRYLPRRLTARTLRPESWRTVAGTRQRRRASRTAPGASRRLTSCDCRPRRVTSTSGSSGIANRWNCLVRGIKYTYTARPMCLHPRLLCALVAGLAAVCLALGEARAQTTEDADDEDDSPAAASGIAPKPPASLPALDLTKQLLYEFLLGEIATQRGSEGLAAQTYVDLAKRTRDPRVARRAVG